MKPSIGIEQEIEKILQNPRQKQDVVSNIFRSCPRGYGEVREESLR
ncbi:MAG: hypothetical protein ABIH00_07005 [Armatimonadota bacterium]